LTNQGCFNVHNEWQTLIDLIKVVLMSIMNGKHLLT